MKSKNEPQDPMPEKSPVALARETQYEMAEGFYDPEVLEKDPHAIQIDKSELTPEQRDQLEQFGAELAARAGVSLEAAESAIFGFALCVGSNFRHSPRCSSGAGFFAMMAIKCLLIFSQSFLAQDRSRLFRHKSNLQLNRLK